MGIWLKDSFRPEGFVNISMKLVSISMCSGEKMAVMANIGKIQT